MNISQQTIDLLNDEYIIVFYDRYGNEVPPIDAVEVSIVMSHISDEYIGKSIKATKKEMTMDYISEKLSNNATFQKLPKVLNSAIKGINAYTTSYGIGVFVGVGNKSRITAVKQSVEDFLNKHDIIYKTEYSDAQWVFRYKISKSSENIQNINKLIK